MDMERMILNQEEIEQLCNLYMEGKLSVEEEHNLAIILSQDIEFQSEIIDDTLLLMGMSESIHVLPQKKNKGKRRPHALIAIGSIAATTLVILSVGTVLITHKTSQPETTYEVYIGGEKITDPVKSREIALENYSKTMEHIAKIEKLKKETVQYIEEVQKIQPVN